MGRIAQLIALILLLVACNGSQATMPTPSPERSGPLGDTWTWDGAAWHRATAPGPTPRYLPGLAYDPKHRVFVMFGGQTAKGSSDETWIWDGKVWKAASPTHRPHARKGVAMAYDPVRQVVVLYGGRIEGREEGDVGGDTWTWDGSDWTQIEVGPGAPDKREGAKLVSDGKRLVLFGGRYANVNYFGDAWTWTGKTWTRVDRNPRPAGRSTPAVLWNPATSSIFVFGGSGFKADAGIGAQGEPLDDAWALTGATWTQLKGSGPPTLGFASAIWDAANKRAVVLLGIHCPNPTKSAWAWDGAAWSELAAPGMSARWGASVAQDPDGKALLFGGDNETGC